MSKAFAWSYSALTGFESCPRQYHQMRLVKPCPWPDPPGEVQLFGLEAHKHIENRVAMGKPLPGFLKFAEPILARLENGPAPVKTEYRLALNDKFQPVEFFAKDAWVRAVGDIVTTHKDKAFQLDWKFGKYREGDGQLKLQSAVAFANMPQVNTITNVYAWMKDHRTTVRTFHREDVPGIWEEFLPRVKRMHIAIQNGDFPPNPSGLCGKYCAVLACEHNGRNK